MYGPTEKSAVCVTARGEPGAHIIEDQGLTIAVRAPANYVATRQHPLIMVYAPAGFGPKGSERFADDLTMLATLNGFVIAYVGHIPMTPSNLDRLASAHRLVTALWCTDPSRIFDLGHSDGGSVAAGLRLIAPASFVAAGSVVSAAGIRGQDLKGYECPAPRPIMIIHSKRDELFPGFGQETAAWWAACHQCQPDLGPPRSDGCRSFAGCAPGADTLMCETDDAHAEWPALTQSMLAFLSKIGPPNDGSVAP